MIPVVIASAAHQAKDLPRFKEVKHKYLPPQVDAWSRALSAVDLTRPAPTDPHRWGYYLPAADYVLTPSGAHRVQANIANWLEIRLLAFTRLSRLTSHLVPPPHKRWVPIISRMPPRTQEQMQAIKAGAVAQGKKKGKEHSSSAKASRHKEKEDTFQQFVRTLGLTVTPRSPLISQYTWERSSGNVILQFDHSPVDRPTEATVPLPDDVLQEIAWELTEVAFRVEMFELDRRKNPYTQATSPLERRSRVAQVFPPDHFVTAHTTPTPEDGLGAWNLRDRARSLEALRQVMLQWPGHPPLLDSVLPLTPDTSEQVLREVELTIATYYCQAFFEVFGRAATVPRLCPGSPA